MSDLIGQIGCILALVGGVVAIVGTTVGTYLAVRSGPRIRTMVTLGAVFGSELPDLQEHILLEVANVGDRPVTVRGVELAGYLNDGGRMSAVVDPLLGRR